MGFNYVSVSWERAACASSDRNDFFPDFRTARSAGAADHIAKVSAQYCDRCPIKSDCARYAESTPGVVGIWGGRYFTLATPARAEQPSAFNLVVEYLRENLTTKGGFLHQPHIAKTCDISVRQVGRILMRLRAMGAITTSYCGHHGTRYQLLAPFASLEGKMAL